MAGSELSLAASSISALLVILGVLVAAGFLARRLRGAGWGQQAAQGGQIDIVASRALGGQHMLVIAQADGQRFLIGVSRGGMVTIGRLDA
jgi:flagellar biogenesis protein FliO